MFAVMDITIFTKIDSVKLCCMGPALGHSVQGRVYSNLEIHKLVSGPDTRGESDIATGITNANDDKGSNGSAARSMEHDASADSCLPVAHGDGGVAVKQETNALISDESDAVVSNIAEMTSKAGQDKTSNLGTIRPLNIRLLSM